MERMSWLMSECDGSTADVHCAVSPVNTRAAGSGLSMNSRQIISSETTSLIFLCICSSLTITHTRSSRSHMTRRRAAARNVFSHLSDAFFPNGGGDAIPCHILSDFSSPWSDRKFPSRNAERADESVTDAPPTGRDDPTPPL